jgi:hypothetical protein
LKAKSTNEIKVFTHLKKLQPFVYNSLLLIKFVVNLVTTSLPKLLLFGQIKDLEGEYKSLEDQIKTLEDWQMYRETCAESDSLIWGTPFLLGTVGELFQWCLRRQPSAKSLSNLFWKRRWSSAMRRTSTYLRMSPPNFARFADSYIDE